MTGLLLDTTAYIALTRGHEEIRPWVGGADSVGLSPVSVGELLAGFRKGNRYEANVRALRDFLDQPRVRVLDVTVDTADRYAVIRDSLRRAGTPIPSNDAWLAATAMEHGWRLLTSDQHFRVVPQIVVEWFAFAG